MEMEESKGDDPEDCDCKASIMVVDDIEMNIVPVREMIKRYYQLDVETATNGRIAVEKYIEKFKKKCGCSLRAFRLILMDI